MAHQTITLRKEWFTRSTTRLLWRPPGGQRVRIDSALLPNGVSDRFLSNFLISKGAGLTTAPDMVRMDLTDSQSGGFGGGTGSNLSSDFDSSGKLKITYKTHSWTLPDSAVGDDTNEPYIWTISGIVINNFIDSVNDGLDGVDAELIIWDGQGTNPFTETPVTPPVTDTTVGWFNGNTVTKHWSGATELEKSWIGSNVL